MSIQQGLYARAAIFAVAAGLMALVVEVFGRSLVAIALGPDGDVAATWTGVRMAGYCVVFLLAMLAIGRVAAAYSYGVQLRSEPDSDDLEGDAPPTR